MASGGVDLGSAYGSIEINTEGATQSVQTLAASMRDMGTKMSLAFTAPLAGIAVTAINSAADFEQSLNIMGQVSGATATQMAGLQAQALQLGAETSFSAGEAATAMLELSKAGLSVEETAASIGGVMDLAAAGGLGLAQAAEITANTLNSFNLDASESSNVANLLAAAANASSVEVTDLAQGMNMASAVFASSNQSVGDLNTALALLGNNGIKGSDAGTSLKTMMMRLTAPTKEAAGVMAEFGISVYDAQGNTRALPDIMADLQQAMTGTNAVTVTTSGLTSEQAARMEKLAGVINKTKDQLADYQSGVAGVAQSENDKIVAVDRLNRVLAAAQQEYAGLSGITGTTSTSMKTLTEAERNQALATLFGADAVRAANVLISEGTDGWAGMATQLGEAGVASDVADARMKGMAGALEYLKGSIDSFLIGQALPFLDSMSGIVRTVADGITAIGGLPEPLRNAALAFGAVLAAAGPLMLAISGVAAVFAFLTSPIGLVVLAVGALAAAWASNFGDIQGKTAAAWAAIQPALAAAWGWLQMALPLALAWLQNAWSGAFQTIQGITQGLWTAAQPIMQAIAGWLTTELPNAVTIFKGAWDAAFAATQLSGLGLLKLAIEGFKVAWDQNLGGIQQIAANVWAAVQPVLLQWAAWLGVALPTAVTWLQGVWAAAWPAIQATWDTVWGVLSSAWTTAQTWLTTTLPAALTSLQTAWTAAWPAMQTAYTTVSEALVTSWTAIQAWLETTLPAVITTFQTAWDGLMASFTTGGETTGTTIATIQAAWDAFAVLFAPAMERLGTAFGTLPAQMGPVSESLSGLMLAFQNLWTAVQPILMQLGMLLMTVFSVIGLFAVNFFAATIASLGPMVTTVIDQISATINTIATVLTEATTLVKAVIDGDWATVWDSAKNIFAAFVTYFRDTIKRFSTLTATVFSNVYKAVVDTLTDMGVDVPAILEGIKGTWEKIWASFKDALTPVFEVIANIQAAIQAFSDWIASIVIPNPFQPLLDAAEAVKNLVPGGNGGTPPDGNAEGTSYAMGGLSWLHERGPELGYLYPGEKVLTNGQSNRRIGSDEGRNVTINVAATINKEIDINHFALKLGDLMGAN